MSKLCTPVLEMKVLRSEEEKAVRPWNSKAAWVEPAAEAEPRLYMLFRVEGTTDSVELDRVRISARWGRGKEFSPVMKETLSVISAGKVYSASILCTVAPVAGFRNLYIFVSRAFSTSPTRARQRRLSPPITLHFAFSLVVIQSCTALTVEAGGAVSSFTSSKDMCLPYMGLPGVEIFQNSSSSFSVLAAGICTPSSTAARG
mmetsp:Transcript_11687/g.17443  ORF Transcript_11687/g.17443 Transcript_11687/m.17443 type:complete len:202 (+) Transcript_11687:1208-1813(+)